MANGQNPDDEQERRNRYRELREREGAAPSTATQDPPENRYRQLRDTTTWTPEPEPEAGPSMWDRARQLAGRVREGFGRIQADTGELEEATAAGMTGRQQQPRRGRELEEAPATRGQDVTVGPEGVQRTEAVDGPQTAPTPEPGPGAVDGPRGPQDEPVAPTAPISDRPVPPSRAWLRDIQRQQQPQTRLPGAPIPDPFNIQDPLNTPIPDEVLDRQGPDLEDDHSYLEEALRVFPRGVGMTIEGTGNMIQALSMRRLTRDSAPGFSLTGERIGETVEAIPGQRATGRFISDAGEQVREQFAPSESVSAEGALQLTNPRWWIAMGGDAVFTLGLSLGTGGVATGLGWGRGAQLAAFSTPTAVLEGGMAYGETLDHLLEQGLSEEEAHAAASGVAYLTAAGAVLLEQGPGRLFMFDELPGLQGEFGKRLAERMATSRIVQMGAAMGTEALQEISQEAWADTVQRLVVEDPDAFKDWFERYAAAGILGGLAGGIARGGQITIESQKLKEYEREIAPFLNSLPQDVRADVERALGLRRATESSSASETHAPSEADAADTPPPGTPERRTLRNRVATGVAGLIDPNFWQDEQFKVQSRQAFQRAFRRMDARPDVSAVILDVINLHGMNEILGSHAAADAAMAPMVETVKQIHAELGGKARDLFRRDGDAFVAYVPAGRENEFLVAVQDRIGLVPIGDSDFVTGFRAAAGPTSEAADQMLFEVKNQETFQRYRDEGEAAPAQEQQPETTDAALAPELEALAEQVANTTPGTTDRTDDMALQAQLRRLSEEDRTAVLERGRALRRSRFDPLTGQRIEQEPTVEPSQELEQEAEQQPVDEWDRSKLRPGDEWTPLPLTDQMRAMMAEFAENMGISERVGDKPSAKKDAAEAKFAAAIRKWRQELTPLEYDSVIAHMRKARGFPLQSPSESKMAGRERLEREVPRETVDRLYNELQKRDDDFGLQARRTIRMWEAGDIGVAQVVEDIGRIEDGLLAYLEEPVDLGSFARAWQEHTGTEFPQVFETWLPRRAFVEEQGIDALPDPIELRTSVVNTAAEAERIRAELEGGLDPETGYELTPAQAEAMTAQFNRVQRRFIEQAELFRAAFGSEPANLVFADFLDVETDALTRFADRVKLYVRPGKIGEAYQLMQGWDDKKLTDRYEQYVRRWTKLFIKGARTEASDARVHMNNWGEIIAGTKTTESGKNARGNRSQQAARIVAAASLMQQRGLPIRTEREITSEVKRADIDEWNRELFDQLPSMDLELVQAEVQRTMHERGKSGNQINQRLDERMFLLYRELERRGVDPIELESGSAQRFDGVRETRPSYTTRRSVTDMEGHWFSRVLRAIDDAKYRHPKSGGQWIAEIVKRSPQGVSKMELEWQGFRKWLEDRKDTPLTTAEVRRAAEQRVPRFTEIVYSQQDRSRDGGGVEWRVFMRPGEPTQWVLEDQDGNDTGWGVVHIELRGDYRIQSPQSADWSHAPTVEEAMQMAERAEREGRQRRNRTRPRWGQYTYQKYGNQQGSDYREVVIQYQPAVDVAVEPLVSDALLARLEEASKLVESTWVQGDPDAPSTQEIDDAYTDRAMLMDLQKFSEDSVTSVFDYQHMHWNGVRNPLAHLRMTKRFLSDETFTHVEEAQSDIHQGARTADPGDADVATQLQEFEVRSQQIAHAIRSFREATEALFYDGIELSTTYFTPQYFRWDTEGHTRTRPLFHSSYIVRPVTREDGSVRHELWQLPQARLIGEYNDADTAQRTWEGLTRSRWENYVQPTEEQGRHIISGLQALKILTQRSMINVTDAMKARLAPLPETSEWAGLLVRRAFMDAALRGDAGVSFATGDQAREALGLRQQGIERIEWEPGTGQLRALNADGNQVASRYVPKDELNNYVGAEVADQLRSQKSDWMVGTWRMKHGFGADWNSRVWTEVARFDTQLEAEQWAHDQDQTVTYVTRQEPAFVEGEGLELGGMGNRVFYDEIMVGIVEKEAKRWGLETEREIIMDGGVAERVEWGAWVVDDLMVPGDLTDVALEWVEELYEKGDELVDGPVALSDLTEIFEELRSVPVEDRQEVFLDLWRDGTVDIDIRDFMTRILGHEEVHIVYNNDDVSEQILSMEATREEAIAAARQQSTVFDGIFVQDELASSHLEENLVVRIPPEVRARILNEGMPTVREHNRAAYGSEAAQLDAFDAMVKLSYEAGDRLELVRSVGSHAAVELRGQTVTNPATAALLVRPWRSKQVESFGMLFMGWDGEVLGQEVLTSGAIDYVAFSHRHFAEARARATRLGATRMLVWHNHPSGDPTPSTEDQMMLDHLHRYMRDRGGPAVEGLVLNDTTASFWRPFGKVQTVDLGRMPTEVAPTARQAIKGPKDAAGFAAKLQGTKPGTFMALYVDTKHRIVVAEPHQQSAADTMAEWMPQKLRAYGARSVIFVVGQNDNKLFNQLSGRVVSELFTGTKVLDVVQEAGGLPARTAGAEHPRWHSASLMARQGEKFTVAWSREDGPSYAELAAQESRQGPVVVLGHTRSGKLIERLKENGWGRMEITSEETGAERDAFLNDDPFSREGVDAGATELYPEGQDPYRTSRPLSAYDGEPWAVDTGAFVEASRHGGIRDAEEFFGTWLRRVQRVARMPESSRPFMVILPDVPFRGTESLETSREWAARAPDGLNYYLPVQDGMTPAQVAEFLDSPEGSGVRGVFLGGTDRFKATEDQAWLEFAHGRGLKFHYARAGTPGKLKRAMELGADSVDSAFPLWTMERFDEFERTWKGDDGGQTELMLTPPAVELREGGPRVREGGPDLFGETGPERVEQGDMMGPAPTDTPTTALATVSRLEGKVRRGEASESELARYEQARSLLRVNQGQGLDEAEVRARIEDDGMTPDDNLDLFTTREVGPEYDPINTNAAELIRQEIARLEDELAYLSDDEEAFAEYDRIENDLDELQSRLEIAEAIERGDPETAAELLWGTTDIPTGGIYVLPDGRFLDGSQAYDGGEPGYRILDHRQVGQFFSETLADAGSGAAFMTAFMRRGNIRWSQTSNGTVVIDFIQTPTPAQLRTMREAIAEGHTVYIMRSGRDGAPIAERRLMGPGALELTVQQLAELERGDSRILPEQDGEDIVEETTEGDAYMELDSFDEAPPIMNTELPTDLTGFDQIIAPYLSGRIEAPGKPIPGTPVSASQVIGAIARITEAAGRYIPIRVGRMTTRRALGYFRVRPEVIRTLIANDIPTAIHEAAHALEKVMWGWPKGGPWTAKIAGVNKKMQSELVDMGKALYGERKPAGGYKREGWAEFLRAYVTQDEATLKMAPAFREWFEWTFLAEHQDVAEAIEETRWTSARYQGQGSVNRARANMEDPAGPASRWKRTKGQLRRAFSFEKWIDMAEPLQRLSREVEERTGRRLGPTEDPYQLVTALRTTHSARVKRMITEGMIDLAGNRVGPALEEVRAHVKPNQYEDFAIFLWAKRAMALLTDPQGVRNPGMSLIDAQRIIEEVGSDSFERAASIVYEWNAGVLNYAAQSSPTFREVVKAVRKRDPGYYVPLQRVFDDLSDAWSQAPKGAAANQRSPVKRLKGSGRRVKDPIQAMIAQAESMVKAAHNRAVIDAIVEISKLEGLGYLIEEVPRDLIPQAQRNAVQVFDELRRALRREGSPIDVVPMVEGEDGPFIPDMISIEEQLQDIVVTFFGPKLDPDNKDPIVPIYTGDRGIVWYQVDEMLYDTLSSMDVYRLPSIAGIPALEATLGLATNVFRAGTTGLRASFGLLWNPLRDFQTFYVNTRSSANSAIMFKEYLSALTSGAFYRTTGTTNNPYLEAFLDLGGEMALPLGQDLPHTRRAAHRIVQGRVARTLDPRNWFDWYRDFIQFPEYAPRVAELALIAKELGWEPGTPMTQAQAHEMLIAAKQVTTDFTAAGELSRIVNRMAPFHNASIQGPRANVRAMLIGADERAQARGDRGGSRDRKMRDLATSRFMWRGMVLTAASLMLWWRNKDEDWWEELDARERATHWWFSAKMGDQEELVRIPRAFEVGMIFSALPEALAEAAYRERPEEFTEWFQTFLAVSAPPFTPQPLSVLSEQLANEQFYWDRPIVPMSEQRLPAQEQYNEYTSIAARGIAEILEGVPGIPDLSPRRIDHAIQGMFGPVSRDLIEVVGLGGEGTRRGGREAEKSDIVILGRLFYRGGTAGPNESVDRLYNELEQLQRRQASMRHIESPQETQRRLMLQDAAQALTGVSLVQRAVEDTDRRRQLMELRNTIAREALEAPPGARPVFQQLRVQWQRSAEQVQTARDAAGGS